MVAPPDRDAFLISTPEGRRSSRPVDFAAVVSPPDLPHPSGVPFTDHGLPVVLPPATLRSPSGTKRALNHVPFESVNVFIAIATGFPSPSPMPRQVRIEYPGAIYHGMARGNRREAIVLDDQDWDRGVWMEQPGRLSCSSAQTHGLGAGDPGIGAKGNPGRHRLHAANRKGFLSRLFLSGPLQIDLVFYSYMELQA